MRHAILVALTLALVAWIEKLPGAVTQDETLDEARANLQEAVAMVLEARRELAAQETLWAHD